MIQHADSLADGSIIDGDVCIVGAGPVGLQIGLALMNAGIKVVIAESGEEGPSTRAQDLNSGTQTGIFAGNLRDIRIRQFGGTMHVWGGNCRPLDPIDFQVRSWVPDSGWPISFADLEPYYRRAHESLQLQEFSYFPAAHRLLTTRTGGDPFEETLFRLSPCVNGTESACLGDFTKIYENQLRSHSNPRIIIGCNICQIFLSEDKRSIQELYALSFQGKELHFRAKVFIFACGGIENARILLCSQEDMNCGVGNQGDSVGRYFMEHPHGLAALLVSGHQENANALAEFSPGFLQGGTTVQRRLRLTEKAQEDLCLLNIGYQIIDSEIVPSERELYAEAFSEINKFSETGSREYYLVFLAEQHPHRSSRVMLCEEKDFFGMPKAHLNWRLSALDHRTVSTSSQLLLESIFARSGFAFFPCVAPQKKDWIVGYGAHHMGTTRMSASPNRGVVDQNCKIHGLSNGFCAGSSVFSTSGMSNPTLTAMAIGLRLARHIIENLSSMKPSASGVAPRRPKHLDVLLA